MSECYYDDGWPSEAYRHRGAVTERTAYKRPIPAATIVDGAAPPTTVIEAYRTEDMCDSCARRFGLLPPGSPA